jgi:hypothetical protein
VADFIKENVSKDGIERQGFLQYVARTGTGVLYTVHGLASTFLFKDKQD